MRGDPIAELGAHARFMHSDPILHKANDTTISGDIWRSRNPYKLTTHSINQSDMPATKVSTVLSNCPQPRHSRSYPIRTHSYDRDSKSTYSDANNLVRYPDVEGMSKICAEAIHNSPMERHREIDRKVASRTPRRTQSHSRTYMRQTEEAAHEVRGKDVSEHRSHRSRREENRLRGDNVHVSKTRQSSREASDRHRTRDSRRSKTTEEASRSRPERSHREDKGPTRRQSERKTSYQEGGVHTPLRREKRSVAENTEKRVREEPPVRRYNAFQHSEGTRNKLIFSI